MPFKSKAQQRFMFSQHPEMAKEFADATPDISKLPDHVQHMADGGEVKDDENKDFYKQIGDSFRKSMTGPVIEDSTLQGFANMLKGSTDTAKGYADGGEVDSNDPSTIQAALSALTNSFNPMAPQLAQGAANVAQNPTQMSPVVNAALGTSFSEQPQGAENMGEGPNMGNMQNGSMPPTPPATPPIAPPIGQMMQKLNQTPPTNPGIYQGISADDRAKLMQSLLAKQSGTGNLVAQGVGGIGDAIANSFGHGGQNSMGEARGIAEKNTEQRIGAVDTQRQQKLQDLQANIAQQEADPNSPYSSGMRQFLSQLTGKPMPSGMSAAMLKGIFPDYVKIFDAKMQSTTAQGQQGIEAGKALTDEGFFSRIANAISGNKGADYLESRVTGGSTSSVPPSAAGWSVKR